MFQDTMPEPAGPALLFRDLDDIQNRLIAWIGPPPPREVWDPLTHLIYSICSARTKDPESMATMRMLRERYDGWPTGPNSWDEVRWEKLRDAPLAEIEDTLRLVTFPERKAPQLKGTLQRITDRTGALSLQFLARYRTDKVRAWVEELPGAGVKASAAVVNFSSLRRPAIAIDAHHQRIAIRLGIVPEGATTRQVEQALMHLVPGGWTPVTMDEHHTLVKKLGQQLCTLREPQCRRCPLQEICVKGQAEAPGGPTSLLRGGNRAANRTTTD
ncbi:MAG: endonuclease III domain-containing protein [Janthinobacterium lividum]